MKLVITCVKFKSSQDGKQYYQATCDKFPDLADFSDTREDALKLLFESIIASLHLI